MDAPDDEEWGLAMAAVAVLWACRASGSAYTQGLHACGSGRTCQPWDTGSPCRSSIARLPGNPAHPPCTTRPSGTHICKCSRADNRVQMQHATSARVHACRKVDGHDFKPLIKQGLAAMVGQGMPSAAGFLTGFLVGAAV